MKLRVSQPFSLLTILSLLALASGAYLQGYDTLGHKWGTTSVPYYVNPQSVYVSSSAAISAVQMAASGWKDQTRANVALVYSGTTNGSSLSLNNKNEVFFRNDSNGSVAEGYVWWDGSGRLVDGDIVFHEGAYQFFAFSGCGANGIYVENVGIHEFGHMLGLLHSSVAGATMQPAMQSYCDTTQLTLEPDDISGIESLYPPGGGSPPPANTAPAITIAAPTNNASFSQDALIAFSASATDAQDGNLTSRLRWTSNLLAGVTVGTGGSFSATLPIGAHLLTATVTDNGNLSASKQVLVVVTAPSTSAVLTARGYKVKGRQAVDLSWTGLGSSSFDVFRNGTQIASPSNVGAMTDDLNTRGGGTYSYKVCAAGTTTCTNTASVTF
jgi:hypothetical protein